MNDCESGLGFFGWFGELKLKEGVLAGGAFDGAVDGGGVAPKTGALDCGVVFSAVFCMFCANFSGTGGEPGGVVDAKLKTGFWTGVAFGSWLKGADVGKPNDGFGVCDSCC